MPKGEAKSGASTPKPPAPAPRKGLDALHRDLGWTAESVRADIEAEGKIFDEEMAKMRGLGVAMQKRLKRNTTLESKADSTAARPFARRFKAFDEAVAAGTPQWSDVEESDREMSVFDLIGPRNPELCNWARVSGDSMRDAGIVDGCHVLVDTGAEVADGDIVLAHLAGEGQVVKRLEIGPNGLILASENPNYPNIQLNGHSGLTIHGVVVGIAISLR